jgi:lyso-ornithine lipid O-acyltransferase
MGEALQLLRNSAALSRTVAQALADYRRRKKSREPSTADRAEWLHTWCGILLRRLEIPITISGSPPAAGLIVSNHLSYLDILVFSATAPAVFVSKSEVRNWPLFGMLTTMAGTVYIDRRRKSDTRNANEGIRRALEQGLRVIIFPEGTSSDGKDVLPFYPSLFEPAVESGTPITAAHIGYKLERGSVGHDVAYWGTMTFFPHLLKLLSRKGLSAELRFQAQPCYFADRKQAAIKMREEVLQLHSSSSATAAALR